MIAIPRPSRRVVGLVALLAAAPAFAQQPPRPLDLSAPPPAPAIQLESQPVQTQPPAQRQTQPAPAQPAPRQAQPTPPPAQRPAAPAQRPAAPALPTELPPAGATFVVIDSQRVIAQSAAGLGLRQQVEKLDAALRTDVQKQEAELKAAELELQRQRQALAPEAFQQKALAFQKRVQEVQTRVQTRRRNLDKGIAEAQQKIGQTMVQVVNEIAQERTYAMVIDRAAVMVFAGQLEITQEALNRLNRKLPSVTLQVAAN